MDKSKEGVVTCVDHCYQPEIDFKRKEPCVYCRLAALIEIKDSLSDLYLGLRNPGFAKEHGGIDGLRVDLQVAYFQYEDKFNTIDESAK
jgi:hypothetical protein